MNDKLAKSEKSRYAELKKIIRAGITRWVDTGLALAEVNESKLYREEYATFEEFSEKEYGVDRRRAYRMIEAARAVVNLPQIPPPPTMTESQGVALAAVPPAERAAVVERAQSNGKPLTARAITEAAEKPEKPDVVMDRTGTVIPPPILDEWRRAEEWAEQVRAISAVKCAVDDALKADDAILAEVTNITVANLINVGTDLKCILPYAVCWTCAGHRPARCSVCKGRGFVSKFRYDSICPSEIKQMRKSAAKAKAARRNGKLGGRPKTVKR